MEENKSIEQQVQLEKVEEKAADAEEQKVENNDDSQELKETKEEAKEAEQPAQQQKTAKQDEFNVIPENIKVAIDNFIAQMVQKRVQE